MLQLAVLIYIVKIDERPQKSIVRYASNVVQNVIQKLYKAPKEEKKGKKLKKGVDKRG